MLEFLGGGFGGNLLPSELMHLTNNHEKVDAERGPPVKRKRCLTKIMPKVNELSKLFGIAIETGTRNQILKTRTSRLALA